jgi:uncharacterized protein HemX
MVEMTPHQSERRNTRLLGQQPVMVAAAALAVVIIGLGGIFAWRSYNGVVPESERLTATRLTQARVAQASEQLVEKTKGLEATQQQSIDQLQVVQDQLLTVQRLLAAQQSETKKLNEQIGNIAGSLDSLRQSFATASAAEAEQPAARPATRPPRARAAVARAKPRAAAATPRKRSAARS